MKHNNESNFDFVVPPISFDKNTEKELLQYCLGATMYMPGTKRFTKSIIERRWPELTSMVMCFEDAIDETELPMAEENVINFLDEINDLCNENVIEETDLPLIILRVRNYDQFVDFTDRLNCSQLERLTAINFPKFDSANSEKYLAHLHELNKRCRSTLYGMPILESESIVYKETRFDELEHIRSVLSKYNDYILNVRVGGTDFSSKFGVRRGIDYTIYDIIVVRDCLSDIINYLGRENGFTISGPVWEYFSVAEILKLEKKLPERMQKLFNSRKPLVDDAVDGLIREIIYDKANGFIGKTVIHPSHVRYVNAMYAVTKEEYDDAMQILGTKGGVIKSSQSNKMNEVSPHRNWAKKIIFRSKAYGVINNERDYYKLFWGERK